MKSKKREAARSSLAVPASSVRTLSIYSLQKAGVFAFSTIWSPALPERGKPAWINAAAEFVQGDLRDRIKTVTDTLARHRLLFFIKRPTAVTCPRSRSMCTSIRLAQRKCWKSFAKKIADSKNHRRIIARPFTARSRLIVPSDGLVFPPVRPIEQLHRGDWQVHCPICGAITKSVPTPENAPVGGETVYGLTKVDQEKLVLLWGKQMGIPTVALRYSCTYGPRQSIFNPYTGVIAIFCTRLLNNLPPVFYEDGEQTRDFSFVEDIARANLLAAETDKLDGLPVNVGSGRDVPDREIAAQISNVTHPRRTEAKANFAPGEMRHFTNGTRSRIRAAGLRTACRSCHQGIRTLSGLDPQPVRYGDYF